MIETYQTDAAQAILGKVGWPEWTEDGSTHHLGHREDRSGRFSYSSVNPIGQGWGMGSHLALCLLRNHLREWLAKRGKGVAYHADVDDSGPDLLATDYDEALLARAGDVLAEDEKERTNP
jgi:hypothetical protein